MVYIMPVFILGILLWGGNQEVGGWPGECLHSYSCQSSQQCEIVSKLASHLR